jgi:partner of Y14 and mago
MRTTTFLEMPSATCPDRPSTPSSHSGIQTLATGGSVIPSSIRPDGSTRKEIKVRPGYRPPEDQEKYRNRNVEARSNIGKGGIPGAELASSKAGNGADEKNKNAKRRDAARRKAAANAVGGRMEPEVAELGEIANGVQTTQLHPSETNKLKEDWRDPGKLVENKEAVSEADEVAEREKKVRNLRKKLRQARELKEKKEGGGELLPEQFAKVKKIQELIRDLDRLGYDVDGEPMTTVNRAQDTTGDKQG